MDDLYATVLPAISGSTTALSPGERVDRCRRFHQPSGPGEGIIRAQAAQEEVYSTPWYNNSYSAAAQPGTQHPLDARPAIRIGLRTPKRA